MSMTKEVPIDVVERILLGLDVKDIKRCKSVCKSWHSIISSPGFVKAHLKHQKNKNIIGGGHRRIKNNVRAYLLNEMSVVGSCNGLVCVSPKDDELDVINPSTREINKLQKYHMEPDIQFVLIRGSLAFGFGYDASTDDYKVVTGFMRRDSREYVKGTDFYVLSLKSNIRKFIGQVNYVFSIKCSGVFCGGALHWFMTKTCEVEQVIMSVDLSTNEINETPQPEDAEYQSEYKSGDFYDLKLGVIKGCLCIYSFVSSKIWVMENNKWELYDYYYNESKYDVVHSLTLSYSQKKTRYRYGYIVDDGIIVPCSVENRETISDTMFVESLVSPHSPKVHTEGKNDAKCNIRKGRKKRKKRSSKHKRVFF